jgi:hypothetical protein
MNEQPMNERQFAYPPQAKHCVYVGTRQTNTSTLDKIKAVISVEQTTRRLNFSLRILAISNDRFSASRLGRYLANQRKSQADTKVFDFFILIVVIVHEVQWTPRCLSPRDSLVSKWNFP